MSLFILKKLRHPYIWKRIFYERATEPLHLNLLALGALLFGSTKTKIAYDVVVRQPYAFGLQKCAELALQHKVKSITILEFGVAAGAGLLNLCKVAQAITQESGIQFKIVGFDSGQGMPKSVDYRDHPDLYRQGDFPMPTEALQKSLPSNAELILGDVAATVPTFLKTLTPDSPIGFISLDVDYYSSTVAALSVLQSNDSTLYLPLTLVYLDDLEDEHHNSRCGELLAIDDFNRSHKLRVIEKHTFLRSYRIFQRARWIDHMYYAHILDHPLRQKGRPDAPKTVLENPYLREVPKAQGAS